MLLYGHLLYRIKKKDKEIMKYRIKKRDRKIMKDSDIIRNRGIMSDRDIKREKRDNGRQWIKERLRAKRQR